MVTMLYYNGYILPIFDYCSSVWGTCNGTFLHRLTRLQKSAARIILNATRKINWPLQQIKLVNRGKAYSKQKISYGIYSKALHGLAPQYLTDMFQHISNVHDHSLRSTTHNNLYLDGGKTQFHNKGFSYIAGKEWNALSVECRSAKSLSIFKKQIYNVLWSNYLISQCFYGFNYFNLSIALNFYKKSGFL